MKRWFGELLDVTLYAIVLVATVGLFVYVLWTVWS